MDRTIIDPGILMPTVAGDVVIQRRGARSSRCDVWVIVYDGQQLPELDVAPPRCVFGWDAAVRLACEVTARTGGRVFTLDWDTGTWMHRDEPRS